MSSLKVIRWGILGCGKIAHKFASDLAITENGILYACASKDKQKASDFATQYNALKYFDSYEALAECQEVDVIYIATPHSFHHAHTMLCLQHHKPVLCEKPLAIQYEQVKHMIAEAHKQNVFLMEAMWTAFLPAVEEVKFKIESGEIGTIRHLSADFGFQSLYDPESRLYSPALGGGSLLDIGIYPLFISLLILGYPDSIKATAHLAPTGVDQECTVLLAYKNGSTASLYSSFTCFTDTKCEIFGTKGKITIPGRFHEQRQYYLQQNGAEPREYMCEKIGLGYYHEVNHVNTCLLNNKKESPIMTFQTSLDLIQLMDEIRNQIGVVYTI